MQKIKFLCVFLMITGIIQAQNILTLSSALNMAEKNNPAINQVRLELKAMQKFKYRQFGIENPQLFYMKEGVRKSSGNGFSEQSIGVSQSIDFPLTSFYRFQSARNEVKNLSRQLNHKLLELRAQIKEKYSIILYKQQIVHLREQQLHAARQLFNAALTRLEVGQSSQLDVMKAEIEVANANNALESAKQTEHTAHYVLFNLIGLHPEEQLYSIQFNDSLVYLPVDILQKDVLDRLEQMPLYEASGFLVKAAASDLKSEYSTILPDLSIDVYQQDFGSGYDHYGFQVGLDFPLWFLFNEQPGIQQAHAKKQQMVFQQKEVRLQLKKEIELSWHGYYESKLNIERYNKTIRPRSSELRNLTLIGYQEGELSLIEFLDAQRTYLTSEENYLEALLQYYTKIINLEKYLDQEFVLITTK